MDLPQPVQGRTEGAALKPEQHRGLKRWWRVDQEPRPPAVSSRRRSDYYLQRELPAKSREQGRPEREPKVLQVDVRDRHEFQLQQRYALRVAEE